MNYLLRLSKTSFRKVETMTADLRWTEKEETASTLQASGSEARSWPLKWGQVQRKIL